MTDRMPCCELVELVTERLEDALPPHEAAGFEAHLASCADCATYVAQLQAASEMSAAQASAIGADGRDALLALYRDWKAGVTRRRARRTHGHG